jgi:hypothetical protein
MPLVFTTGSQAASGHAYDDRTGESYEYPNMYRNMIQPGEDVVFYRGRRKPGGGVQPSGYFAAAVVGRVMKAADDPNRWRCEIVNYEEFPYQVPLKDDRGQRYEQRGEQRGYYQPGVRRISNEEYSAILSASGLVRQPRDNDQATT